MANNHPWNSQIGKHLSTIEIDTNSKITTQSYIPRKLSSIQLQYFKQVKKQHFGRECQYIVSQSIATNFKFCWKNMIIRRWMSYVQLQTISMQEGSMIY